MAHTHTNQVRRGNVHPNTHKYSTVQHSAAQTQATATAKDQPHTPTYYSHHNHSHNHPTRTLRSSRRRRCRVSNPVTMRRLLWERFKVSSWTRDPRPPVVCNELYAALKCTRDVRLGATGGGDQGRGEQPAKQTTSTTIQTGQRRQQKRAGRNKPPPTKPLQTNSNPSTKRTHAHTLKHTAQRGTRTHSHAHSLVQIHKPLDGVPLHGQ